MPLSRTEFEDTEFEFQNFPYDPTILNELIDPSEMSSFLFVDESDASNIFNPANGVASPTFTHSFEAGVSSSQSIEENDNMFFREKNVVKRKRDPINTASTAEPAQKRSRVLNTNIIDNVVGTIEGIQTQIDNLKTDILWCQQECDQTLEKAGLNKTAFNKTTLNKTAFNKDKLRERRLIQNRFSASSSRIRAQIKKLESEKNILQLKNKISELEAENAALNQKNIFLQEENEFLKNQGNSSEILQFSTHVTLRLSQDLSSGQSAVITARQEVNRP